MNLEVQKLRRFLSKKAPKFWKAAAAQSWSEASEVLKNFGDAHRTRRKLEAELLDQLVAASAKART